jgi:uncharacterized membrane protein (UPF0127 family)
MIFPMNKGKPIFVIVAVLLVVSLYMILPPTAGGEGTALVKVNGIPLIVEIAERPAERSLGLMYRKSLPENMGMLFIYRRPATMNFWMKNTYIPLSIAYIDTKGYIIAIFKMEPLNEKKTYRSPAPAVWALEVNQGWFEKNGVNVGHRVRLFR